MKNEAANSIENSAGFLLLRSEVLLNRTAHAYLLVSPDRAALHEFSRSLAALALLGTTEGETARLIMRDLWHDVTAAPFDTKDGKKRETVLTADIDAITETLHRAPSGGDKKFYIIDFGETMNPSSQNKLLKSLEEPPPAVHFIINALNTGALLPTLVSRCRLINVSGAEGRALDAAQSKLYNQALAVLLNQQGSKSVLANSARMLEYKSGMTELIGYMELILRDVMVLHGGCEPLIRRDADFEALAKIKETYSLDACNACLGFTRHAKERLRLHGNQTGTADELLFNIAETKTKYK